MSNLREILSNIDTSSWGINNSKTVDHLQAEIDSGEAILVRENDQYTRKISVLYIDVFCHSNNALYKLVEEKQVFSDGRTRIRHLSTSLGEKIKPHENESEAVQRAIQEELSIKHDFQSQKIDEFEKIVDSTSYPGLKTKSKVHQYAVFINSSDFNPSGYQEIQPDKTTYFVWQKVTDQ